MNKKYYWLRLKENFFKDKRIKKLRSIAGGDTYTIIYLKMQLLSLQDEGYLYFEKIEETFEEELALEIDEDVENIKVVINFLKSTNLLKEINENIYELVETRTCIGSESASAERVRKYREKQKEMLQCNTLVTKCNTEIEIDKDIDINKEKNKEKKKFKKPTIEEIKNYCLERNNNVNAEQFFDYYESKGWIVGKSSMKDWKASVRTWERNNFNNINNNEVELKKDKNGGFQL